MNFRSEIEIKRKGLALPMTLVILLFGSVLVATAFYIVQNMYSTSRHTVTHTELYNAAQTGIEMAKSIILENKDDILVPANPFTYDHTSSGREDRLDSIRARTDSDFLDKDLRPVPTEHIGIQNVEVNVDILDCYYELDGVDFEDLGNKLDELPPQWEAGSGSGGSFTGMVEGTSVIMDPGRNIMFGGGEGQRRYVIRSTATYENQAVTIEVLVRVKDDD